VFRADIERQGVNLVPDISEVFCRMQPFDLGQRGMNRHDLESHLFEQNNRPVRVAFRVRVGSEDRNGAERFGRV